MTDSKQEQIDELSKKISDMVKDGAKLSDVNFYRRKLNAIYTEIRQES